MVPQSPPPEPKWTAAAITLVVIGLLILVPSGLCTGVMGISALFDSSDGANFNIVILAMALIVGGPFVVIGALLVRTGLRERRRG
jgi:hypothetical protein